MDLFNMLNPEQREAVEFVTGPLLVLAGAGSGKTRVVTMRIVKLLELGIPASQILGLTFTNKAAQEMKDRVNKLTHGHVSISTFHSLGAKILRESIQGLNYSRNFVIYDQEDSEKLLKICLAELQIIDKKIEPKAFKSMISHAKNELQKSDEINDSKASTEIERLFPKVYALYQQKLREYQAVDFDDLLYLPVQLFKECPEILSEYQNRWPFLLIDEYQDTNAAQYQLVRMLVAKSNNIFVVGDPDQSIYSWRGANINNILNFEKDYPGAKIVRLEQNYRSHTHILNAANALIGYNAQRYKKNLWSDLGPGEKIKYVTKDTERGETEFVIHQMMHHHLHQRIPLSEMVIFYRTNFQSRTFEDSLLHNRIPYVIVGGVSFYQRREIKDILAFLRMVQSGVDIISFTRTINIPKRGIGEATIEKLRLGAIHSNLSLIEYCAALVENREVAIPVKLSAKQKEGLSNYIQTIHELRQASISSSLKDLIQAAIDKSHYVDFLREDKETFDDRKDNIDELVSKAAEWEDMGEERSLSAFLEELSLKTTLDETDETQERLNLMTIHNGKGLEFKVVFLVGMEDDLFPHANVRKGSKDDFEEERRLCYVGITRAKDYLYLTNCKLRYLWGTSRPMYPSRFIREIPPEHIEKIQTLSLSQPSYKPKPVALEYNEDFINDIDQTKPHIQISQKVGHKNAVTHKDTLNPGEAIFHHQFGVGVVQRVYEGSAGLTYEILFAKDNAKRNIVAQYANLSRV